MLRERILKKIYFTTLIIFILFIISSFTMNKSISNIKTEYHTNLSSIYLLNDDNYLLKVNMLIGTNLMENIPVVINSLKVGNKHYSGLKGLIPNNTKINNINLENNILTIDFNNSLLNVNENLEEKIIESLVYSLLSFKEIQGIKITINGQELNSLPKSGIRLNDILTKDFGINKEYSITSMNDIQKVTLYYYEEKDNINYYVPVTKYINSHDDKIKVIIDNLKNSYLTRTNLMSYINEKIRIENYEKKGDIVTLSFANIVDFTSDEIKEEVIYTLANSIFDSTDIVKVVFLANDNIISIKQK